MAACRFALIASFIAAAGCSSDEGEPAPTCDADGVADLESCGVADYGWNIFCEVDIVYVDDLTATYYCAPGDVETLCTVENNPDPEPFAACGGPCVTDETIWVETIDEFQSFDLNRVCGS